MMPQRCKLTGKVEFLTNCTMFHTVPKWQNLHLCGAGVAECFHREDFSSSGILKKLWCRCFGTFLSFPHTTIHQRHDLEECAPFSYWREKQLRNFAPSPISLCAAVPFHVGRPVFSYFSLKNQKLGAKQESGSLCDLGWL